MSTLQISLAIIGGLVLAGVVAYNAWVTSKSAPRTARERPGLDGAGEPHSFENPLTGPVTEPDHDGVSERIEPVMGHAFEAASEPEPQVAADGVFRHLEFGRQRGGHHRFAAGQPGRDLVAPGQGEVVVHVRSLACTNKKTTCTNVQSTR